MTAPDLPAEAVEAAVNAAAELMPNGGWNAVTHAVLAAALPHLRAQWEAEADGEYRRALRAWVDAGMPTPATTRAQVLAEVDAALRDWDAVLIWWWKATGGHSTYLAPEMPTIAADYLRDTLAPDGGEARNVEST